MGDEKQAEKGLDSLGWKFPSVTSVCPDLMRPLGHVTGEVSVT